MNTSRIETRRRELNIPVDKICEAVGMCRKSYYLYIKGKPIPSNKLSKLADVLNCSTDYLLEKKNHTHITVTDDTGAVLADISQNQIINHKDINVLLT